MAESPQLPSDRQLADATRAGSPDAWAELVARHRPAVLATANERDRRGAEARVDDVFDRLRREVIDDRASGELPTNDFGVRAIRPRALALLTGGTYAPTPPGSPETETAELAAMGVAFGRLSEPWQTVLWHHLVELEPAASIAPCLGRSAAEVAALETAAERGLVDGFLAAEMDTPGAVSAACRPIVPLLGAYHRGTLPDAQRRAVDAHIGSDLWDTACVHCARRLEIPDQLAVVVPPAIVPGLTGLGVDRYRGAIGVAAVAFGAAALAAQRSVRANRRALMGAVAVVVVALLGAALLIRTPFGDLDGEIADLLERSSTTTTPDPSVTVPPDDSDPGATAPLPSRIELVFSGVTQGVVYVPGGPAVRLGLTLSTPAPVYRNGTATIDAGLTNTSDVGRAVRFVVRLSSGVSFDELAEGDATCVSTGGGATCSLELPPGASTLLSLRFALDQTVSNRLVVVPNIRSRALDLPVETVPGLVLGLVGRGRFISVGESIGSSAKLDLPVGAEVDTAWLVWQGGEAGAAGADEVRLTLPGGSAVEPIPAGPGVESASGFRSSADVTDLVRAAGAGSYTVVSPSDRTGGDGTWMLLVVTREADPPRRLVVVVDPERPALADVPAAVDVPIRSPAPPGPPRFPVRPLVLTTRAAVEAPRHDSPGTRVSVNGVEAEPDGGEVDAPVDAYALDIDSTEDALFIEVFTTATPVRIAAIGVAIDIVT